ncbi:hypothetical protein DY000_02010464 [Brassica cretica]|uniref:Uncharacterized protein n=1 Tax=Brassica cretica TaxID=69181 RepID=A0ABQ7BVK2_BRACR|nr:hypothetical protein DY000_02010464 [Brassica cretica]
MILHLLLTASSRAQWDNPPELSPLKLPIFVKECGTGGGKRRRWRRGGGGRRSFSDAGSFDLKAISSASLKHCYLPMVSEFTGSFFHALTKITVALGPNGGSITDADYHHETLDNL